MAKTKISLVILGSVILLIIGALISYFILVFTNNIQTAKTAIEITIQDNSKVYDGTPLSAKEYKITNGTLLKGHNIDINYYGEITEAGIGESNCNLIAFFKTKSLPSILNTSSFKVNSLTFSPLRFNSLIFAILKISFLTKAIKLQ